MLEAKPKRKDRRTDPIFKSPIGNWPLFFLYLAAADCWLPAVSSFPKETVVEPLPDNKYRISAWVDLSTNEGRQSREISSVVVSMEENGWTGEQISVIPQL